MDQLGAHHQELQDAYRHGNTLHRWRAMFDANFYDVETHEEYWLSGPYRDRADTRSSNIRPQIDEDVHRGQAVAMPQGHIVVVDQGPNTKHGLTLRLIRGGGLLEDPAAARSPIGSVRSPGIPNPGAPHGDT